MLGQSKLRLDRLMAAVAQSRLRFLQEAVVQPASLVGQLRKLKEMRLGIDRIAFAEVLYIVYEVRRVALIAGDAVAGMFGMREKLLLFAADVAGKAAAGIFFRRAA